ncbi:MAG TPA: adenosylmethionine--8-amino-7-oxononanoate transaminase [Candidatus Limnocylindria bacterium]|nr:adenosylmethionine--8-amino-7-oxononanoate transaminase [Candidatus Limnocylindria bacterium]
MTDAATLAAWDRQHLWHPFTQMADWMQEEPLVVAAAEGCTLIGTDGRRYLDGVSSLWCNVHGHRHPRLDAALRAQLDRVAHTTLLGLGSVPSIELAHALVQVVPGGLTRVFYSDAGATAVEAALRIALQYQQLRGATERVRFASLAEGYHGDTLGAVGVGYSETFHRFVAAATVPAVRLTPPHVFRWQRGMDAADALAAAIAEAETTLAAHAPSLAALIVEPLVQGAAGMWIHPPEYLAQLAALTRQHGMLFIADEVATGFGRTGTMFACEQAGVTPDLMCIAKGLSGGYLPLAATLATEEVFAAFLAPYETFRAFFHGHTFTGNALACAVALASLQVFAEERTLERLGPVIARLRERLARDVAPLPHVGEVRQQGAMVGIELVADRHRRTPYEPAARIGQRVVAAARRRGVVLRPLGNVIVLMPPLAISLAETDLLLDVVRDAIAEVTGA